MEVLGEEKARVVWSRIDIVGDIAVIKMPLHGMVTVEELRRLAERILEEVKHVKSVWLAEGPVESGERVRSKLTHLAGEERTVTVYREHGCRFKVDIARVFITPRLNYEHLRIARLVRPGETVVNMFAGAGLFSIIIARYSKPRRVYSIDINPYAYKYMVENVRLNRVEGIVEPILGDAAKVVEERLRGVADRVLMPLPELALDYLPYALAALRGSRGVLHVYLHVEAPKGVDPMAHGLEPLEDRLRGLGVDYRLLGSRVVRTVGPRRYQVVYDVEAR